LLTFLAIFAVQALPVTLFSGGSFFSEIAGVSTIGVMALWPILSSSRTKDPDLAPGRLARGFIWGTVYNFPMTSPTSFQIVKTSLSKMLGFIEGQLGIRPIRTEEFVVTPKVTERRYGVRALVSKLKG
jgi:hypothetical protein